MNMKVYVKFLLNKWKKRKVNLFYKREPENEIEFFQ